MASPGDNAVLTAERSWVALVGRGDMGKAAAQDALVDAARAAGLRVGGCLQRPVQDETGQLAGYDVVNLDGGARRALARVSPDPELCEWGFDLETFAAVGGWVVAGDYDLTLLELGILEARGQGHWPATLASLGRNRGTVALTLRPSSLAAIGLRLPDPALGLELPAAAGELEEFVADVVASCRP